MNKGQWKDKGISAIRRAKAIALCVLMLLGFENALAAYSSSEVSRIQDLVGKCTIQSVAEIPDGVDIGVADMSTSNLSAIRSAIERMGIDPDAVSFHHESAIGDNPWYRDYAQEESDSGGKSPLLYLLVGLAVLSAVGIFVVGKRRAGRRLSRRPGSKKNTAAPSSGGQSRVAGRFSA